MAEMPSIPFLVAIAMLGAAAAVAMALARPLAEEGLERMNVDPTYEI